MLAAFPEGRDAVTWFGGGMDLTPYYGFEDDAQHFHRTVRDAIAPIGAARNADLYPKFKRWCDEYFFLKHRGEPRGIGGVFFDDYADGGFDGGFALVRAVGDAFVTAYRPILARRKGMPWGEREREFQTYRRGRYVEFNLVFDRGTLFGPAVGRAHREHPDVDAAGRHLALRLEARTGNTGGAALQRIPAAARLGRRHRRRHRRQRKTGDPAGSA